MRIPVGCLTILASFLAGASGLLANEAEYELVRKLPPIRGELTETLAGKDESGALWLVRRTYQEASADAVIVTIVREAHCGGQPPATVTPVQPHVVAIQYRPKAPKTFLEATFHDFFLEVYVTDPQGHIRRYHQMGAQEMAVLTEKLRPVCTGI